MLFYSTLSVIVRRKSISPVLNKDMRLIFQRLLSILLLGMSANTFAAVSDTIEERWYEIEVIIFENLDQAGISSESWPNNPGLPNYNDAIELIPPQTATLENSETINLDNVFATDSAMPAESTGPAVTEELPAAEPALPEPFQMLPNDELNLTAQETRLSSSEKYYPLLHVAWRQPVLSQEEAKAIHIYSNMGRAQSDDTQSSLESLAIPPHNEFFAYQTAPEDESPMNVIDGTIKITRGKYLHLEADILYRVQAEKNNDFNIFGFRKQDEELTVFRMQESRRLRSGELHYFDHPLFGMLVMITPYQLPDQQLDEVETIPLDESAPADEGDQEDGDQTSPVE